MEYKCYEDKLREACSRCDEYAGEDHDYGECEECPVLYLAEEADWFRCEHAWSDYGRGCEMGMG